MNLLFGSDQIWRYNEFPKFTGLDPVYWGDYPKNSNVKKIAYAVSMGKMDVGQFDSNEVSGFLANFSSISVREKPLMDYVQPLVNNNIEHVLDPVFLLTKRDWDSLAEKGGFKKAFKKKYLLIYNLNSSEEVYRLATKIAKEKNLVICEFSGMAKPFNFGSRIKDKFGPREFINAFLNAEFVIASSFHGVAFSILFEKNFFSMGIKNNADRVKSLLSSLDISNRYIETGSQLPITQINYRKVNSKLDVLKKKSKVFINKSILE
ncbi:polysaccharide pyruvyl transferase family protein [Flavicella sp.]|uniref:polysaccharide pyruvyl transferase family protein n=1 Tax=Flavicella sp. TaxID=2957742 RepID=UPI0030177605